MSRLFTDDNIELILESLDYQKTKFENYTFYPSNEMKKSQVNRVNIALTNVKGLQNGTSKLTRDNIEMILQALEFTSIHHNNTIYSSYEIKRLKSEQIYNVLTNVRALKSSQK